MKEAIYKAKNFVKKHDNIFAILVFFLSIYGIVLNVIIINSDELWNFSNLYKLYNGFEIYKDVNIIVTPLFFYTGLFLCNFLGANFLTFRIYHIIIMVSLYFVTYLLLKELKIDKKIAIIITLFLIVIKKYYLLTTQANYNTMALLFCLIGIYTYIKKYRYNSIIQGIILFLIFATKQNIGVLYAIGLLVCTILDKGTIKEKIKKITIQIAIATFFVILMLLYFYQKNILGDFFSFAILGIKEFANENIYIDISNIIIILFFIIINMYISITLIKNKKIDINQNRKILILESFSIPLTLIGLPILNETHFLLSTYIPTITFIYLISIMLKEFKFKNTDRKIIEINFYILIICMIIFSTYNFIGWILTTKNEQSSSKQFQPFFGGIISEENKRNIDNVLEYIENNKKEEIILSPKATYYSILLNKNNGILDLPLKGNFGKEGEEGLLNKIKNLHNTEILIESSEYDMIWQESTLVREYIKNNMEKIGEIEEFDVYMQK